MPLHKIFIWVDMNPTYENSGIVDKGRNSHHLNLFLDYEPFIKCSRDQSLGTLAKWQYSAKGLADLKALGLPWVGYVLFGEFGLVPKVKPRSNANHICWRGHSNSMLWIETEPCIDLLTKTWPPKEQRPCSTPLCWHRAQNIGRRYLLLRQLSYTHLSPKTINFKFNLCISNTHFVLDT